MTYHFTFYIFSLLFLYNPLFKVYTTTTISIQKLMGTLKRNEYMDRAKGAHSSAFEGTHLILKKF